jgi:hypothetical protein
LIDLDIWREYERETKSNQPVSIKELLQKQLRNCTRRPLRRLCRRDALLYR